MMLNNLQFMLQHPMSQGTMAAPFRRFIAWQFRCRVQGGDITVPWVNDARLVARRGMEGATGNIYYGLHEFSEMGFLLHFLRPEDLFCDIWSNFLLGKPFAGDRGHSFLCCVTEDFPDIFTPDDRFLAGFRQRTISLLS